MTLSHTLGYPRIGADPELKKAVEAYWRGGADRDVVTVGDFACYEQVVNVTTPGLLHAVGASCYAGCRVDIAG